MTRITASGETKPALLGWAGAPRLGPADLVAMLWAERVTVILVGALVCLMGFALAFMAPKSYTARAELLVRLGQEYVYQPHMGGAGAGASPDMQNVVNAELRLLGSGAVTRRAIQRVGIGQLYPAIANAPGSAQARLAAAERAFAQHLKLETAPQTPSIALSFEHRDPRVAARALNTLVDEYIAYRRDVLVGGEFEALSRQSDDLDARVGEANDALAAFLTANEIGDYESELASLAARLTDVDSQLLDARAKRGEASARAAALRARAEEQPAEIELYSESDARRALVQAQMDREQMLSRYQPDAPPVRELDRRISQLEIFLAGGDPPSLTRRGPNPVRQDVESQLYAMEAETRAQRGREASLQEQGETLRARLRRLQEIGPEYRELLRQRTILEQNATSFASRAEEARAFSQLLGRSTDNISQVERASPPTQGKSMRLPIAALTVLIAGLAALAAGLARGLMRRNFPTPSSAARTLGAPVLAVLAREGGGKAKKKAKAKDGGVAKRRDGKPELKVVRA